MVFRPGGDVDPQSGTVLTNLDARDHAPVRCTRHLSANTCCSSLPVASRGCRSEAAKADNCLAQTRKSSMSPSALSTGEFIIACAKDACRWQRDQRRRRGTTETYRSPVIGTFGGGFDTQSLHHLCYRSAFCSTWPDDVRLQDQVRQRRSEEQATSAGPSGQDGFRKP